jgi:hypothetical protein
MVAILHANGLLRFVDWIALQSLAYGDGLPNGLDALVVLAVGPETTASRVSRIGRVSLDAPPGLSQFPRIDLVHP